MPPAARALSLIRATTEWEFVREAGDDGRAYAVKRVRPNLSARARDAAARALDAEFQFLRQFDSPRVLKPLAADAAAGAFRYEDVQGSLREWADRRAAEAGWQLTTGDVALVLLDALDGLAAVHARGFGHGSLGLRSLLLDPDGHVKLGDFHGYRKGGYPDPTFQDGLRAQAPEFLPGYRGTAEPDMVAADLYNLAFAAVELYAGTKYYSVLGFGRDPGGHEPEWLRWHNNPAVELEITNALKIAEGLHGVLAQLTRKDPTQRVWRSAKELRDHIQRQGHYAGASLKPIVARSGPKQPEVERPPGEEAPAVPWLRLTARSGKAVQPVRNGILVGTDERCDIRLKPDPRVDGKHAFLAPVGDRWYAYDLKSRAGVTVNGAAAARVTRVRGGTVLGFGPYEFTARLLLGTTDAPFEGEFDFYDLPGYKLIRPLHRSRAKEDVLYLGVGLRTREYRAVRVFARTAVLDQKLMHRFIRGLKAARQCRHENVVRVYAAATIKHARATTPTLYLATEYLPGGSLADRLEKAAGAPLAWKRVARMGREVGAALVQAEAARVVHRNIHPGCVLFAADGTAKLGDFSLVRGDFIEGMHQLTTQSLVVTDQEYQSPEGVRGEAMTWSSDVYSLAVCMYHALTGENPFRRPELTRTFRAIQNETPRPLAEAAPDVPPPLAEAVTRAMHKDPAERHYSVQEFVNAFAGIG